MKELQIQKLGTFRNSPRFYKEGKRLELAGFAPGTRFSAKLYREKGLVLLEVDSAGDRTVSHKKAGAGTVPVIDINSATLLEIFEGLDAVRVVVQQGRIAILAIASDIRQQEREGRLAKKLSSGEPLAMGSISHGVGILSHALHSGLEASGVEARLAFANDIEADYMAQAQAANSCWNDQTIAITAPMQELVFDDRAMAKLPALDILEGGIPCTAASSAGRAKKGLAKPEDDRQVGHLIVSLITMVVRKNPSIVVLENVPNYLDTASMGIFRSQMADLRYTVSERILEGHDFGALENRKRMVAIAVSNGIKLDIDALLDSLKVAARAVRHVSDILDPIPLDDPSWSKMQYLKDKEVRDKAAGKGFRMQPVLASDFSVPTVTRGYMKRRSTDPFLQHPENPDLLRLFTPREHARIKGVPEQLIAGLSATTAHEALGQGICYGPFVAVGKAIGLGLKSIFATLPDAPRLAA